MIITRRQALAVCCLPAISVIDRSGCALAANRIEIVPESHLLSQESAVAFRNLLTQQPATSLPTIVLPGIRHLAVAGAQALQRFAENGGRIICECGLAFSDQGSVELQRRVLAQVFGLRLGQRRAASVNAVYISFHESSSLIRPFGHCFAVSGDGCEPIAYFGDAAVAVRQRIGGGEFIYLGAMLGPHLLASDPDALRIATHLLAGSSL